MNSKIIKEMPFLMPSDTVIKEFSTKVTPLLKAICLKQESIIKLTEARDRLLPKLMSGEIEV